MTRAAPKRVFRTNLSLAIAFSTAFAAIFAERAPLAARGPEDKREPAAAPGPRYIITWVDGSQTVGGELADWGRPEGRPTVERRSLFDPKNPARTILDPQLSRDGAESFVEFVGGDQLPGRVVACLDSEQAASILGPPRLLVETPLKLDLPGIAGRTRIPVLLDSVRRIVHGVAKLKPVEKNTLRHADGRRIAYRAARWKSDSLELLTENGVTRIALDEIVDLALPGQDENDGILRELATLSPQLNSRLMRAEFVGGLRLTTSLERLLPRVDLRPEHRGAAKLDESARWLHIVQPAWALEPLGLSHRSICSRLFFAPQEVLLSRLRPVASRHYGAFSAAWTTSRQDRNVEGNPLMSAGQQSLWGIGVHAGHDIEFELPLGATQFQVRLGLDTAAGGGGAVIGRVLVDGKPAFESPLIVGSKPASLVGPISLGTGAPTHLTLVADPAYNAPKTADPLDIRDIVDWLEPIVKLDSQALAGQVARVSQRAVPGLAGWDVEPSAGAAWRLINVWDASNRAAPSFRSLLELSAPVTFTHTRRVTPPRDALVLWIAQVGRAARSNFEVSISGRRLGIDKLPVVGERGEMRPIVVPLADYAGQNVEVSVRIEPTGKDTLVDWRGTLWQASAALEKPVSDGPATPAPKREKRRP